MKDLYLGREPIIDANSTLCTYEVLYKFEHSTKQ